MYINPVKQNIIRFNRIDDRSIMNYILEANRITSQGVVTEKVATIPNPKTVNPVKIKEQFSPNENNKYTLSQDIVLYDATYPIKVYINGRKLNDVLRVYNTLDKEVTIDYTEIQPWDIIDIEYYFDGIEYKHTTSEKCNYKIKLDIDYTLNTVGNHNVIV